ncbi:MAG: flagellar biosynthesis protein FlhF, partial [Burkholderiales bacterium]|nr:flagellar biosynthesis protein FlhF [Burkholderiales bacterium]
MNVKRFTARTSRDALALVRQAFGDDAVVMSTRPCAEGVEMLAMAPESVDQLERVGHAAAAEARPAAAAAAAAAPAPVVSSRAPVPRALRPPPPRAAERQEPRRDDASVREDVEALQMSTLSFQDYVRERMLRRRAAEAAEAAASAAAAALADDAARSAAAPAEAA